MGLKHNHVATGTNSATEQVSVNRWNEDHVIENALDFPAVASPDAAPGGNARLFATHRGARVVMGQLSDYSSAEIADMQPHLGSKQIGIWSPPGNSTNTPGILGFPAITAIGTGTARNVTTTNRLTRMARLGYVSSTTAGNLAGLRAAAAQYTLGDGMGGFGLRVMFGVSDASVVSGARMFIGMWATTTAPTNVDPAAGMQNHIGLAKLAGSSNLHIVGSRGASAMTPIDLGVDFPADTLGTVPYEFSLWAPQNGGMQYQVRNLDSGATAFDGINVADLPLSTTLLCFQAWRCNNATAAAVGLDIASIYIEQHL